MHDLHFASATRLAKAIRTRQVSAVEALDHFLARVQRFNPALNAIIVTDAQRARARAKQADRALAKGEHWGPLHGVPMTVKESYDIAGLPTTRGLVAQRDNIATSNALVIDRLLGAGAVIFGKTNVPASLADFQSYNPIYGTTNNPWDLTRTPGGSSGGSAASLAAGLCALETGSDIGGSIRNPAAYCGVYGHKPTWGLVPPRGHGPAGSLAEADLSVVGPLARTAEDLALALGIEAGPDEIASRGYVLRLPPPPRELKGLRVGVWRDESLAPVDASVLKVFDAAVAALRRAGAKIDLAARPDFDPHDEHLVYGSLLNAVMSSRLPEEAYNGMARRADELEADGKGDAARPLKAATARYRDYLAFHERRTRFRWAWHELFKRYDVMLAPITVTPAFVQDQSEPMGARTVTVNGQTRGYFEQTFWAGLAVCSYLPSTAAPIGFSPEGLPIGLQILGPELGDRTTIWLAGQLAKLVGGFVPPPGY